MKSKKEEVYLVGDGGPEHNQIVSIHRTYAGALKAWNKHRIRLLNQAKSRIKDIKRKDSPYLNITRALSEKDPSKIDNYPHETPYIQKIEIRP